jgi:hypothetical protein
MLLNNEDTFAISLTMKENFIESIKNDIIKNDYNPLLADLVENMIILKSNDRFDIDQVIDFLYQNFPEIEDSSKKSENKKSKRFSNFNSLYKDLNDNELKLIANLKNYIIHVDFDIIMKITKSFIEKKNLTFKTYYYCSLYSMDKYKGTSYLENILNEYEEIEDVEKNLCFGIIYFYLKQYKKSKIFFDFTHNLDLSQFYLGKF